MPTIEIRFYFSRGEKTCSECAEFEVEGALLSGIDDRKDELLFDLNADLDDDEFPWDFDEFEVGYIDLDYANPAEFSDLDKYAEYVEACELHGEGYRLRYADIGEHNFQDEYNGCWSDEEEFAQQQYEDIYGSDNPLYSYVDWERYARDLMMDYSSYDGSEGTHIFRN